MVSADVSEIDPVASAGWTVTRTADTVTVRLKANKLYTGISWRYENDTRSRQYNEAQGIPHSAGDGHSWVEIELDWESGDEAGERYYALVFAN